jgi:hypothetical protein
VDRVGTDAVQHSGGLFHLLTIAIVERADRWCRQGRRRGRNDTFAINNVRILGIALRTGRLQKRCRQGFDQRLGASPAVPLVNYRLASDIVEADSVQVEIADQCVDAG